MFNQGPDRGPPSALRGWLSDVYIPALLDSSDRDKSLEALANRLGAKASLDDPLHGRATGLPAIRALIGASAKWMRDHDAKEGGALRACFKGLAPIAIERGGAADDGRTCALEAATAGGARALLVFERGDSGLIRVLRLYGDF